MISRSIIALAITLFTSPALAADISLQGDLTIIIEGEIKYGDDAIFREKANLTKGKALVHLESLGGNLDAALQIGEMIRQRGFATDAGGHCTSACALIWLGGKPRFIGPNGKIGFHAVWNKTDGEVSAQGNAAVGMYAKGLGLSYPAAFYITSAAPKSMTPPLTLAKAKEVGIEMCLLPWRCTSRETDWDARKYVEATTPGSLAGLPPIDQIPKPPADASQPPAKTVFAPPAAPKPDKQPSPWDPFPVVKPETKQPPALTFDDVPFTKPLPHKGAALALSCRGQVTYSESKTSERIEQLGLTLDFVAGVVKGFPIGHNLLIEETNDRSIFLGSGAGLSASGFINRITGRTSVHVWRERASFHTFDLACWPSQPVAKIIPLPAERPQPSMRPLEGRIISYGLNLRAKPDAASEWITELKQGTFVLILDEARNGNDKWLKVHARIGGVSYTGWIAARFVAPDT